MITSSVLGIGQGIMRDKVDGTHKKIPSLKALKVLRGR
jgi:hypothetical protein